MGREVPFIQTIFSPLSQARYLAGQDRLTIHLRQAPELVKPALEMLTERTVVHIEPAGAAAKVDKWRQVAIEAAYNGGDLDAAARAWRAGDEIIVKAEVPGLAKDQVRVEVENGVLTLHGERKFEREVKEENYHRVERTYGAFHRSFSLPGSVDAEKVRAEMKAALAKSTHLPVSNVGLKATTNEGVGDLGRGLAIAAHAVALIAKA